MDRLVLHYHWEEFKKSDLDLERKEDVANSDTAIGIMFSGPAYQNWATFLYYFFQENKDAESRLLREALGQMKKRVRLTTFKILIWNTEEFL